MNQDPSLRADCARCCGLCCVALAFDRSALFAADKAAGEPCRHLSGEDRCLIHARRAQRGYGGCVGYDCLGAGQLVTQDLFGGRSWRDCDDGGRAMFLAFAGARRVQEWRLLLDAADQLGLTPELARRRRRLAARLAPKGRWTSERLARASEARMARAVAGFLTALRAIATQTPPEFPALSR